MILAALNHPRTLACVMCLCFLPFTGNSPIRSLTFSNEFAQSETVRGSGVLQVGEELTYNVSYASINIGQVRVNILEKVAAGGKNFYKAIAYIDSYSGIPFVNLHVIYESHFEESIFSQGFRSRVKEDSKWYETLYEFDYPGKRMHVRKGWLGSNKVNIRDSLQLDTLYQDGLSLYYYARQHLRLGRQVIIPTMIREEKVRTAIDFYNKRTSVEIDAVKYPVDVIEFEGNAEFVGVYGMTGGFQGWFSNDEANVPILAKMNVLVGNVRIELTRWKRPGWNPPQFVEKTSK